MARTYLLIGTPGSGKTTAACTCEHPTLIVDVDCKAHKMENIRHLIESGEVTIHPIRIPFVEDSLRERALNPDKKIKKQPRGYLYVCDLLNEILENGEAYKKYNTVVLDSLSRLVDHMVRLLIFHRGDGRFGKKKDEGDMNWPSWGSYLSNLVELFGQVIQMDKNFICTAHEKIEFEKDDLTNTTTGHVLGYWPKVDGQMMKGLPEFFDEVYYMDRRISKVSGNRYLFRTIGSKHHAKTSLNLSEFEPADITGLWKIHNKEKEKVNK